MNTTVSLTLQITLLGMGLVFGAIILLWGLMAALTRLLPEGKTISSPAPPPEHLGLPIIPLSSQANAEDERRKRAAVAALAVALAQELDHTPHAFPTPPSAAVSPWQAVSRANAMNKKGRIK